MYIFSKETYDAIDQYICAKTCEVNGVEGSCDNKDYFFGSNANLCDANNVDLGSAGCNCTGCTCSGWAPQDDEYLYKLDHYDGRDTSSKRCFDINEVRTHVPLSSSTDFFCPLHLAPSSSSCSSLLPSIRAPVSLCSLSPTTSTQGTSSGQSMAT